MSVITQIKITKREISMREVLEKFFEEISHSGFSRFEAEQSISNSRKLEKLKTKLLNLECKHTTEGNFCSECGKKLK